LIYQLFRRFELLENTQTAFHNQSQISGGRMFAKHHEQFSRFNGNSIPGTRLMHTLDGDMANMDWGWGLGFGIGDELASMSPA